MVKDNMEDIFSIQGQNNNVEINKPKKKMDKILLIQLSLLIAWVILTTIVYFFGYDFFEPFIKV